MISVFAIWISVVIIWIVHIICTPKCGAMYHHPDMRETWHSNVLLSCTLFLSFLSSSIPIFFELVSQFSLSQRHNFFEPRSHFSVSLCHNFIRASVTIFLDAISQFCCLTSICLEVSLFIQKATCLDLSSQHTLTILTLDSARLRHDTSIT